SLPDGSSLEHWPFRSFASALPRLLRLHLPNARRGGRPEVVNEASRSGGHFVDRAIERDLVGTRRARSTAQLADKLDGRRADLLVSCWWLEIGQGFDASAHGAGRSLRHVPSTQPQLNLAMSLGSR